jgi:anti-anti-sigma factor
MNMLSFSEEAVCEGAVLIELGRMLDNNNAEELVNSITGVQARGCKFIVLDFSHLEFISSAGVGAILGTIDASRDQGGDIILCNVPETVAHVFQVLDLWDFLTIMADRRTALAACQAR